MALYPRAVIIWYPPYPRAVIIRVPPSCRHGTVPPSCYQLVPPVPPNCRHQGTPELSPARCTLELSSSGYPRAVVSARLLACALVNFFFELFKHRRKNEMGTPGTAELSSWRCTPELSSFGTPVPPSCRQLIPPVPPNCRHRGTPELSSARCTLELSLSGYPPSSLQRAVPPSCRQRALAGLCLGHLFFLSCSNTGEKNKSTVDGLSLSFIGGYRV